MKGVGVVLRSPRHDLEPAPSPRRIARVYGSPVRPLWWIVVGFLVLVVAITAVQTRPTGSTPVTTPTVPGERAVAECAAGDEFCGDETGRATTQEQPIVFTTMESYDRCVREAERQDSDARRLCGPRP